MKRFLRDKAWFRTVRLARLRRQAHRSGHTDWTSIVEKDRVLWQTARSNAKGRRILIATNVGLHFGAARLDGLIAAALTMRGARVEFLFCDSVLPACMAADLSWYQNLSRFADRGSADDLCNLCFQPALDSLSALGLPIHRMSDWIENGEREKAGRWAKSIQKDDLKSVYVDKIAVGEHALAGALRFFARGTLEAGSEGVLDSYLQAARLTQIAVDRLAQVKQYDVAILHHGIYVPQGIAAEVLKNRGVRVVTWNTAYRKKCFIFSHDDTYHRTMMTEPVEVWDKLDPTPQQEEKLTKYLKSRWSGKNDWISFYRNPDFDFDSFAKQKGIDPEKPIIGLLTNVFWDAQLHYPESSFTSMREWLVETVRYFASRPDLQLVIRAHPAERTGSPPSRETTKTILQEEFSSLPANVFLIASEDRFSTYALAAKCRACIIYATKAGIELATMGVPVITAGEAWIRGKDLAIDPNDVNHYFQVLAELPKTDPPSHFEDRARKYAYHFFFRRMIPLAAVKEIAGWPPYQVDFSSFSKLERGVDAGLDTVCQGILEKMPFIYTGIEGK